MFVICEVIEQTMTSQHFLHFSQCISACNGRIRMCSKVRVFSSHSIGGLINFLFFSGPCSLPAATVLANPSLSPPMRDVGHHFASSQLPVDRRRNWGWRNARGAPRSGRLKQCATKNEPRPSSWFVFVPPSLSAPTRH